MTPTGSGFPDPEGPGAIGRWPTGLEAGEVERPHVVVTFDTRTGAVSFSGPYRTALGALCAADVEYQVDRDEGGTGELTFHVAALHAPVPFDDIEPPKTAEPTRARRRRDVRHVVRAVAITAAACLPGVGDGWPRLRRTARHRHLLGREAR